MLHISELLSPAKNIFRRLTLVNIKRVNRCCLLVSALILGSSTMSLVEANEIVPRTVLAFYDSELDGDTSTTYAHDVAEMPLNHLGLIVRYQDIHKSLPDEKAMQDVRGILLWFNWDSMPRPNKFMRWMIAQMQAGQRVVIMGSHAFETARIESEAAADDALIDQFWKSFGLSRAADWVGITYDIKLKSTEEEMVEFERSFSGMLPSFPIKKINDNSFKSYLKAYRKGYDGSIISDLVVTGPKGGYVAPDYSLINVKSGKFRYWFLNPFRFFREAFATDDLPKADTTTLSGRRLYYSHVDGDGWRSLALVPGYREYKKTVTEVLLHEVFEKYPDLPVTVAPVAADLDSDWFGTKESQQLAKKIFALPHVEAGSHTFSHPLEWVFFEDYDVESETPFLDFYPKVTKSAEIKNLFGYNEKVETVMLDSSLERSQQAKQRASQSSGQLEKNQSENKRRNKLAAKKVKGLRDHYDVPRAFYTGPFDINFEVQGSVDTIQQFLPTGKRVELLQWSGDTRPFADAIAQTRRIGLFNLNGGDSRFDREFNSLSWVSPVGREVGGQRQIYSSSSNENTYTNLWKGPFYGFGYLEQTLRRTETPWRLKPINIYYHNYSGERLASLNALRKNFAYARSQKITPVTASHFAAIGDGFYTTVFENIGKQRWRIKNRGRLQTIRFDQATFNAIDFKQSQGVIGQMHFQGSLYVHLDAAHEGPVISLKKINYSDREPEAERPYLMNARWRVRDVELTEEGFRCQVQGFGGGEMDWYMPTSGKYRIYVEKTDGQLSVRESIVEDDHRLRILIGDAPVQPYKIRVERLREKDADA